MTSTPSSPPRRRPPGRAGSSAVARCRRALATIGDVTAAARELLARGCQAVLVSLGPDGALFVDANGASHAEAPIDDVVNTVGAGDALLAGFLAGDGKAAALGVAV